MIYVKYFQQNIQTGIYLFIYLFIAHVLKNCIVYILTRSLEYSQEKFISGNFIQSKIRFDFQVDTVLLIVFQLFVEQFN